MTKMWTGPCAALIASHSDPIACRLHRRAGEQSISYETNYEGTVASVKRMEKRDGRWFLIPIGTATGADPMDTFINAALEFTSHDPELFSLIGRVIVRRAEEIEGEIGNMIHKTTRLADEIEGMLSRVRA